MKKKNTVDRIATPIEPTAAPTEMTLRDTFAAYALVGIIALQRDFARPAAVAAYRCADAMLAEREKPPAGG